MYFGPFVANLIFVSPVGNASFFRVFRVFRSLKSYQLTLPIDLDIWLEKGEGGAGDEDRTRDVQLGKLTFYH